jgi:signal transduction histidine kinase
MQRPDSNNSLNTEAIALAKAILEAGDGWHWLTDARGQVLACNRRVVSTWGQGKVLPVLDGPQVQVDLTELVLAARAQSKPVEVGGLELHPTCGEHLEVSYLRIVPLDLPAGWPPLVLVSVTCRPQSQELTVQKVQNEKLQSLTGLAAKIAHELNNPLDGSMRYINLALRRLQQEGLTPEPSGKLTEYLSSAREALGKINEILSDLVRFARDGQSGIETISINDMVEQAVRTLTARANAAGVSIITTLSEDLPRAGGPRLYQVFCNLLKNAIDAVDQRRREEPDAPAMITITTGAEARRVRIVFEDTGMGLPADRRYLFEPFFTTKAPGEGTGLGLAICREIIQGYGGGIRAEDSRGRGARFVVDLPVLDPAAKKEPRHDD